MFAQRSRLGFVHVALGLSLVACGSTDKSEPAAGGSFVPAKEIADVCSILTLADVQTLLPAATDGVPVDVPPTDDIQAAGCDWSTGDPLGGKVRLIVQGATKPSGVEYFRSSTHIQTGTNNTPVSGIGDQANYWEQGTSNGLLVLVGSYSTDITDQNVQPLPTVDQLKPVLAKVVVELK